LLKCKQIQIPDEHDVADKCMPTHWRTNEV